MASKCTLLREPMRVLDDTPAGQIQPAGEISLPMGVTLPEPEPEELPWIMGTWHGLPRWQCALCPWDTLEGEAAMIEHIEQLHGVAPAPATLVQAYDAWGNPK